jgi:putative tricarboxylic transport membrane protein
MMLKSDRWTGIFFILLSAYVCAESLRLGLGDMHSPGPGFISFCTGLILGLMALGLVIGVFLKEGGSGEGFQNKKSVVFLILALFGFLLILDTLGFILSTFLFVVFLLKLVEQRRWLYAVGVAGITAGISYCIFCILLQAQLPQGILSF